MDDEAIAGARTLVDAAQRIVALTGAGISTDSGIPDYRGPNGTWTKDPGAERAATLQHYLAEPETRQRAWRNRLDSPIFKATPNPGHFALLELQRRGTLHMVVTQNVDGLHEQSGIDPGRLVEIHGTAHHVVCWSCGERAPMERALARVRDGEEDPPCRSCGGILKSATISFGQKLDGDDLVRATDAAATCDLLLAVGSTLTVHPAAGLVPIALKNGARLVIVNAEDTAYDRYADVMVRESISDALPVIVGLVG